MEHNLGLTCDPVAGQVQVPCIERNAIASVKAINAARMAMRRTSAPRVSLDKVIETMYETGKDMNAKYRETSRGGLAIKVSVIKRRFPSLRPSATDGRNFYLFLVDSTFPHYTCCVAVGFVANAYWAARMQTAQRIINHYRRNRFIVCTICALVTLILTLSIRFISERNLNHHRTVAFANHAVDALDNVLHPLPGRTKHTATLT